MIKFASVAFAVGTVMASPALSAEVKSATVDGRVINYVAAAGGSTAQAPRREISRDEMIGRIRKARPINPTSNQLDPAGSLPESR